MKLDFLLKDVALYLILGISLITFILILSLAAPNQQIDQRLAQEILEGQYKDFQSLRGGLYNPDFNVLSVQHPSGIIQFEKRLICNSVNEANYVDQSLIGDD